MLIYPPFSITLSKTMLKILQWGCRLFRCIRETVLNIFFILFVIAFLSFTTFLSTLGQNTPLLFEKGALRLNLSGTLQDNHDGEGDFSRLLREELGEEIEEKISVFDVVRAIKLAKKDPDVTGIVLDLADFNGGDLPSLRFVAEALWDFRQEKPLIAVGTYYTQAQYYLASTANEIYLNPTGAVELKGLQYQNLYFKSFFEKIHAVPQIFRVGEYKSAVEPFIRDEMSPEARQNAERWLMPMWAEMQQEMAASRGLTSGQILPKFHDYLNAFKQARGDEAQFALNHGWVTHLLTRDEMREKLIARFGVAKKDINGKQTRSYAYTDFTTYRQLLSDRFASDAPDKIAVINVEGAIIDGESDETSAGSHTILAQLARVREDKQVRGVILRVNSPGGSAVASELIRQELAALQKKGIPLVVSMGGMAASGGYWISAGADHIIADKDTLTGSIGIFGLSLSFEESAKQLGIYQDGLQTSFNGDIGALKHLSAEQKQLIQLSIERGYQRFIELVANGRKLEAAAVEKIAQGQVWRGKDALAHKLVDQLGTFDDAYDAMRELLNQQRKAQNLPPYEALDVQWFIEQEEGFWQDLMREMKNSAQAQLAAFFGITPQKITQNAPLTHIKLFNDPKQSYLYCGDCGIIR